MLAAILTPDTRALMPGVRRACLVAAAAAAAVVVVCVWLKVYLSGCWIIVSA